MQELNHTPHFWNKLHILPQSQFTNTVDVSDDSQEKLQSQILKKLHRYRFEMSHKIARRTSLTSFMPSPRKYCTCFSMGFSEKLKTDDAGPSNSVTEICMYFSVEGAFRRNFRMLQFRMVTLSGRR